MVYESGNRLPQRGSVLQIHTDQGITGEYPGGVTGTMKISAASEGFGLDVETHGPGPVHRHVMSSIRNTNFYELSLVHPLSKSYRAPVYGDGYSDDLDGIDSDGNVFAPEGAGIGVPLDWDWINAHKVDSGGLAEV